MKKNKLLSSAIAGVLIATNITSVGATTSVLNNSDKLEKNNNLENEIKSRNSVKIENTEKIEDENIEGETPEVKPEGGESEGETPEVKPEGGESEGETPEVKPESGEGEGETPEVKPEGGEGEGETPEVKPEGGEGEGETPEVKPEGGEGEGETPEIKPEGGEGEDETPEVKPEGEDENVDGGESEGEVAKVSKPGKLEFDINFPTPLKSLGDLNINLSKDGSEIGLINNLDNLSGTINGVNYKVELYDSMRRPLEEGDTDIYFARVIASDLEKGNYGATISGEGFISTAISDIDISLYSKRVIIGGKENISGDKKNSGINSGMVIGDVDKNEKIDMGDYNLVFNHIKGKVEYVSKYDLNNDGKIDIADLTMINENMGRLSAQPMFENTNPILDSESIKFTVDEDITVKGDINDLLEANGESVAFGNGTAPSKDNPLNLTMNVSSKSAFNRNGHDASVQMEQIVLRAPQSLGENASMPESGVITLTGEDGEPTKVEFGPKVRNSQVRVNDNGDLVINLGSQIAVKEISIDVTGNRGNKQISEIAQIEFINNVYKEEVKPEFNVPTITKILTDTDLHNERIEVHWIPENNVTSYEVKYEKLDEKGNVIKTKKLQTNESMLNILDKDIKPYDHYRVSVQSLNGEWESGYVEAETDEDGANSFDGVPDNASEKLEILPGYQPLESSDKGSVIEVRVMPDGIPRDPRNMTTESGVRSFTITWANNLRARDFDIYYRKVEEGSNDNKWIKANDDKKEVDLTDDIVTNPDKDKLHRGHSYTVTGLEDNAYYEVKVSATNHLGTGPLSETYIASTASFLEPEMSEYKLINRPTNEGEIGTTSIIDVRNKTDEDGWAQEDPKLTYDSENALVDGNFTTSWKVDDWDTGAQYGSNRGSEITFDKVYEIGRIDFANTLEHGYPGGTGQMKITYWDEEDVKHVVYNKKLQKYTSNNVNCYAAKLDEPIRAKKIKIDISGSGGSKQTMSELKFYEYDSLENDVKNLYTDDLRLVLKDTVTQEGLDSLKERVGTADKVSGDFHPDKTLLEKELEIAQKLFDDSGVGEKITKLDTNINKGGHGINNTWQSLGTVVRPGNTENNQKKKVVVYFRSSNPKSEIEISFLQTFGQIGKFQSGSVRIKPGRTEIEIPEIMSNDVEKGGEIIARVVAGGSGDLQVRVSGGDEIPHLNLNNKILDPTKKEECKEDIRKYIKDLEKHVKTMESRYPESVTSTDRLENIYPFHEKLSVLNSTNIEGDTFTLNLQASKIYESITGSTYKSNTQKLTFEEQVDRVYDAMLAWEQQYEIAFLKKGLFREVQDFDGNGTIDKSDQDYFNKHKVPTARGNVKYQRPMEGANGYASGQHIGVLDTHLNYMRGIPYKFDENGDIINNDVARLNGALITHELGHQMDHSDKIYPEVSNGILGGITTTLLNENTAGYNMMDKVYEKVTSNTKGLSTKRGVVGVMLMQPYFAYEDKSTHEMFNTGKDGNLSDDNYFAKLNRAYRDLTPEEKLDSDIDQLTIRVNSKVAGKNLTDFYIAHGLVPNETTLKYVSQFPKETKKIQYIDDEARRRRINGNADMASGTKLIAGFGGDIETGDYIDSKSVPFTFKTDKSQENILGYEILRNGVPFGFVRRDAENSVTTFEDQLDSVNNRVIRYTAVAYDYNLNPTDEVEVGTVKIRHEGGVDKKRTIISSNMVNVVGHEHSHDEGGACVVVDGLENTVDYKNDTFFEGRMLTKEEYNSAIHTTDMHYNNKPSLTLDATELKTLVGLKYTAPVQNGEVISSALKEFKVEVSRDGENWTEVKKGTLNSSAENPTTTIYFDKEGVTGGTQLASYTTRYVRITATGRGVTGLGAGELELITPPGDNIEIGVAEDNQNYQNGVGILSEDYIYVPDNVETEENEERKIPKGSVIITGEYRGNPAFNVPLVLNQNDLHIADKYKGILLADIPDAGNLEEISEGNWIYWVEPQDATNFMTDNELIFAELYRTDAADAGEGGQRMVSDTFKIDVPDVLPQISLSGSGRRALNSKNVKVTELNTNALNKVANRR